MKNKEKIILALGSLSFFLVVYFFIASKEVELPNETVVKQEEQKKEIAKIDLVALKNTYKETVKKVYGDLQEDALKKDKEDVDMKKELESFKGRLINLTVPEEYKVFHLSFIMLIDKVLNNSIVFNDEFLNELQKIGDNNPWLK